MPCGSPSQRPAHIDVANDAPIAVVDTNVVVSGVVTRDPLAPTAVLLDRMTAGSVRYLLSREVIAEYRTVLLRPKIMKLHGRSEDDVDDLLTQVVANGMVRVPTTPGSAAPDPKDAHLFALAETQPGAVVVTGDQALIHEPPAGARVMSPRAFLDLLPPA